MKKLVSLLLVLVMFLSAAALADEAVGSPVPCEIIRFSPEGIAPAVTTAENDEYVSDMLNSIITINDNEEVFGSSKVENLDKYELIELVGLTIDDYDEDTMDEVELNIKFAASFDQDADLVVLLGLLDETPEIPVVEWQSVSFEIEANGTLTLTLTEEQAEAVVEGTAFIAVLQAIAD